MKTLRRELAVAFSLKTQPLWMRVVKWIVLIGVAGLLLNTRFFWWWVLGLPALGVAVHLFYRWKTRGWMRPWGGWDDVRKDGD